MCRQSYVKESTSETLAMFEILSTHLRKTHEVNKKHTFTNDIMYWIDLKVENRGIEESVVDWKETK
jgi:hypothetical protein